ncbi:MAG: DMT family transporter [Chlamydiota bacterium]
MKALPPKLQGILWIVGWVFSYNTAMTLTKFLSPEVGTWMIVLMRSFFGLLFIAPLIMQPGAAPLKSSVPGKHLIRVIAAAGSSFCVYYAYKRLPLSTATSLGLSSSLIVPVFSMLILKERIPFYRWIMIIIGYIGVLCIVRPTVDGIPLAMGVALLANICGAIAIVMTRMLTQTEQKLTLLLYTSSGIFALAFIINIFSWKTFSLHDGMILAALGGAGIMSQLCQISALKLIPPTITVQFEYSRLLLAIATDFFVFRQHPSSSTLFGAAVIIITGYIVVQGEASPAPLSRKSSSLA